MAYTRNGKLDIQAVLDELYAMSHEVADSLDALRIDPADGGIWLDRTDYQHASSLHSALSLAVDLGCMVRADVEAVSPV